jgi:hypothetical protein
VITRPTTNHRRPPPRREDRPASVIRPQERSQPGRHGPGARQADHGAPPPRCATTRAAPRDGRARAGPSRRPPR